MLLYSIRFRKTQHLNLQWKCINFSVQFLIRNTYIPLQIANTFQHTNLILFTPHYDSANQDCVTPNPFLYDRCNTEWHTNICHIEIFLLYIISCDFFSILGSYSWGYNQSEISYEHWVGTSWPQNWPQQSPDLTYQCYIFVRHSVL